VHIQLSGKLQDLTNSEKYRLKRKFKKLNRFLKKFPQDAKKGELILNRDPQNHFHAKLIFWIPNVKIIVEQHHRQLVTAINLVIKKATRQIRRHKRKIREKK
jgi:ribosomal subunit interface protein